MIDAHVQFPTETGSLEKLEDTLEFSGVSGVIALLMQRDREWQTQLGNEELIDGLIVPAPLDEARQMRMQMDIDGREGQICGYLTDISTSCPENWSQDADIIHSLHQIADKNFSLDLLTSTEQVGHLLPILDTHPNLSIMLDHCFGEKITINEKWKRTLREIGRRPHVYYRLSGLATGLAGDSTYQLTENIKLHFEVVLEAFGAGRILYGSGWPYNKAAYPAWLNTVDNLIAELSTNERDSIYTDNALHFYGIEDY